jgi:hypothetical protein
MRTKRGRARLISEYVDARIRRQAPAVTPRDTSPADRDFDELLDLTRELSRIDIVPPRGSEEAVLQQLARGAPAGVPVRPRWAWLPPSWRGLADRFAPPAPPLRVTVLRPAVLGIFGLVVLVALAWLRGGETSLSAGDLLARVDRLDALVSSGEVLHREVRSRFRTAAKGPSIMTTTVHEWLDSTGIRAAAQGYGPDGRLLWTEVSLAEGDAAGARMFLAPDPSLQPRGLLIVRPSARELNEALPRMPGDVRRRLEPMLSRRHVVSEPIFSERWENRILLGIQARAPRAEDSVTVAPWTTPDGGRGYRLRVVEGWRPWVEWRGQGLAGMPARFERVRYVEGRGYLTLRDTAEYRLDDGRVFAFDRETVRTVREPLDETAEAKFRIDVPPGTPVRKVPAEDELRALADAIRR